MPEPVINFQSPYDDQSLLDYMAGRAAEMCFAWKLTPHSSSVLQGIPLPNMVAFYRMELASNDLTAIGSPTSITGKIGNAVGNLNGSNYLIGGDGSAHYPDGGGGDWMIWFWCKRSSAELHTIVCGEWFETAANDIDFRIAWLADDRISATISETGALTSAPGTMPSDGQWHLVVLGYHGIAGEPLTADISLTIDNQTPLTTNMSFPIYVFGGLSTPLYVGNGRWSSGGTVPHSIDALGISHHYPTTEDLADIWNGGAGRENFVTRPIAGTDNTHDLTLPGHGDTIFRSIAGIAPSAIDVESGQESAGLEFQALFDTSEFTRAAVNAGDWNSAKLEVFEFSFRYPDMGQLQVFSGRIGTVREEGMLFKAQATPLTAVGRLKIGRKTGANCDVKVFGDERCKKDLTALTRTGQVVTSVPNAQHTFRASGLATPTVAYENGQVWWTAGANAPRKFEIKSYDNATKEIVLHLDTPLAIVNGAVFTIIEGCNRTPDQCEAYDNIINFRGFRYITNIEEIQRIIRAQ